ncbi:MAG: hypothetical protein JXA66_05090 [Oligoflexia bacterium]|nr:hypothetical protein [Oligoflexia bacterium]
MNWYNNNEKCKFVFANRIVRCSKCGKISRADMCFCPNCGTRIGFNEWVKK